MLSVLTDCVVAIVGAGLVPARIVRSTMKCLVNERLIAFRQSGQGRALPLQGF